LKPWGQNYQSIRNLSFVKKSKIVRSKYLEMN
jgi:hypothetical protein